MISNTDTSLAGSDVTSCVDDVMSSLWQHDADELLMATLKPAVIPTVVENERVTDEDEWIERDILQLHQPPPPPPSSSTSQSSSSSASVAAAVHQRYADIVTDTNCHRPVTVIKQGKRLSTFTRYSESHSVLFLEILIVFLRFQFKETKHFISLFTGKSSKTLTELIVSTYN